MNGAVYFLMTTHGWRVWSVYDFLQFVPERAIKSIPFYKCLIISGTFKSKPRAGQFCKRPHKLMEKAA